MTSGAREARHRQRDDDDDDEDSGGGGGSGSRRRTCCRCWWCCWWWCWWWWWWSWWWWRWCARGHGSSDGHTDARPCLFSDSARARRRRRPLASSSSSLSIFLLLFLTALLAGRLGPGAQAALTDTGNSSGTCAAKNCLTFADADRLCAELRGAAGGWSANAADLRLSFCDAYSLVDLLDGSSNPDDLNCSAEDLRAGDRGRCSLCVQAYQRYDLHAQEKYDEFELMTERYVTDAYSVRTCMEECKMVYKPWLCAQYFQSNQSSCSRKVPCEQYCLEVQQRCPFILPDNDDLIHGGTPSFICTGLSETANAEQEPQCCDVRWELKSSNRSRGTFKRTHPSCQHGSSATTAAASSAPRLGQGRLKLCLLVLVLLHTVATMTASQNSTCLAGIFTLEDNNTPRED